MKKYIRLCMFIAIVMAGVQTAMAQRMIRVTGTVYDSTDEKKLTPITDVEVTVYSCKTVAQGEKLLKDLNSENGEVAILIEEENTAKTDKNGYYEILVPDNGALVFKAGMSEAILKKVKNNPRIDVSINLGHRLDDVVVTALRTELQPEPAIGGMSGNMFMVGNTFVLPNRLGSKFSRLIIQPYTVVCGGIDADTIDFSDPIVVDGSMFRKAQVRKTGYDLERDPLEKFVSKDISLTGDKMSIVWKDTIIVPDPKKNYSCYADFIVENLNTVGYNKNFQIVSCKNKRPLQFLEYTNTYKEVNFNSIYNRERPKVEKRNTKDIVELIFKISSDKPLDTPKNMENLNKIKMNLQNILNEPNATLKELYITGYASPEGSYATNKSLAERRTKWVMNEVAGILPSSVNNMLYKMYEAEVKPWKEVTALMRKDSLNDMADEMDKIIDEYPNDIDSQGIKIKRLSYYADTVVKYLEKLRQVEYRIMYDVYREPTDEEVWEAYKKKGLNGIYTRYEYWKLFQMIKDDSELEKMAHKAYYESVKENPDSPWALAANVLAIQYLKRDTVDITVLEPFIDKTIYVSDYERRNIDTNRKELINPKEIINNQLCMYIKLYDYKNASILAQILPDTEDFKMAKAFAWALGGYYKGGRTLEEKKRCDMTFNAICNSTERNAVVMYLALDTNEGNEMALEAISKLPQNDALTWYFRAIVSARKGDAGFADTMMNLYQCFMIDKKFIHTAKNDGEFTDEVVDEAEKMVID